MNEELAGEGGEAPNDLVGYYVGERNDDRERHGRGVSLLPNGDYYSGLYQKGLRHGLGLYIFRSGARYSGTYKKGKKHGKGTFFYPDGSRYEGTWKYDMKHGYGIYTYANGDLYEGQWRYDSRHGLGSYLNKNKGTKYMGTWINGVMEGPGQLITPVTRYHGSWTNNLPKGTGCFTFQNKWMQHGYFLNVEDPMIEIKRKFFEQKGQNNLNLGNKVSPDELPEKLKKRQKIIAVWHPTEVTIFSCDKMPQEPFPFEYPDTSEDESSEGETPPEAPAYKHDFFKELAEFDKCYLDEKLVRDADSWEAEILPDTTYNMVDDDELRDKINDSFTKNIDEEEELELEEPPEVELSQE